MNMDQKCLGIGKLVFFIAMYKLFGSPNNTLYLTSPDPTNPITTRIQIPPRPPTSNIKLEVGFVAS